MRILEKETMQTKQQSPSYKSLVVKNVELTSFASKRLACQRMYPRLSTNVNDNVSKTKAVGGALELEGAEGLH